MTPGDELGISVVPNSTIQQIYDNLGIGGDKKFLFLMATANSSDAFQPGQIAGIVNGGSIFVMENMGISEGSDRDYNDIIFSMTGATPKVMSMDDVIAKNSDWRTSETGKELIAYAAPKTETKLEDKTPDTTSTKNPPETKPDSLAVETKNSTVSEIPNSTTTPAETKTEIFAVETKNLTVSEIPNFPTNLVETGIDDITGDKIETTVFIQPEKPAIPAESTDILTGEILNISATLIDNPEISSETAENFPLISTVKSIMIGIPI